jgi:predicted component of type VI protein secretion system
MATKLLAISGPLRKSEFPLCAQVAIGTDARNTIRLEDSTVSPQHCVIESHDGKVVLTDLESHFGTFVNGIPVKDRELKSGDQIAVGNSVFLYEIEKLHSTASSPVQISAPEPLNLKVLQLRPDELHNLDAASLAALPQQARVARNLNTLLRISTALGSLRDEAALPWQLLAMIFDVIPAERGAILLTEDGSPDIRSQVAWDRVHGPDHSVPINQEIVRRIIEEKVSLLDSGPAISNSSHLARPNQQTEQRTRLCVPMLSNETVIGLIYL